MLRTQPFMKRASLYCVLALASAGAACHDWASVRGTPDGSSDTLLVADSTSPMDATLSDGAPCGTTNQPCCANDLCSSGSLACSVGTCVACGASDQPCCSGAQCGSGTVCRSGACVPCGGLGNACCVGDVCSGASLLCNANVCVSCGDPQQICCGGDTCTQASSVCTSGACLHCGGQGEPCCLGDTCTGLQCVDGTCGNCGATGQTCCNGNSCATGNMCISGMCNACGDSGEPLYAQPCATTAACECVSGTCDPSRRLEPVMLQRRTPVRAGSGTTCIERAHACGVWRIRAGVLPDGGHGVLLRPWGPWCAPAGSASARAAT